MPTPPIAIPFEEALTIVAARASLAATLRERLGYPGYFLGSPARGVLGDAIVADRDQPPFDRSTRDGFAVRAASLILGRPLHVIGQLRAGQSWQFTAVEPGTAIEIMTGAPLPPGADSVVMVEHVTRRAETITLNPGRTLAPGDNVVPRGAEASAGEPIIPIGTRVTAADVALAASFGYRELPIFHKRRVAIITTGDELVPFAEPAGPYQIRNSNASCLASLVRSIDGEALELPIARDTREDVRDRILQGRRHNLIVLSGGVSMGAYDLVEEVLAEFHAEFFFTAVAMQPGKPVVFGRLPPTSEHPECYFFGLPGNPISTQVTYHAFVEPFLRTLSGETGVAPRWALGRLGQPVAPGPAVTRLLPARLENTAVTITPWHGSGDLAANARANCYAELLPGTAYATGEVIRILLR